MMKRALAVVFVALLAISTSAQWLNPQSNNDVPAYNAEPPRKGSKLRPILPKEKRVGQYFQHPTQVRAYEVAEQTADILHQQPCYCYCDRGHGHNSLRTCFEDEHGAACAACMKEAFYVYLQTKQKKTPAQIRAGIIRGEWKDIDLEKAKDIK